jgi:Chlorophyll A-B binding protein
MDKDQFLYEPLEKFGEGLTTSRPWNTQALAGVELLNGRVAMLGFLAAIVGEWLTGQGIVGQLTLVLRWYLG